MKRFVLIASFLCGFSAISVTDANALVCARGFYRAGCVGPRGGAVVVRRAVVVRPVYRRGVYRRW